LIKARSKLQVSIAFKEA